MTPSTDIRKIQVQGLNHVTLVGADRQGTIEFWEGLLGMPLIFEQQNPQTPQQSQLYFDPGDGRFLTVFTDERRKGDGGHRAKVPGALHHLAFSVSQAAFSQIAGRLDARRIRHSAPKDRGFMRAVYFEDPLGLLIELTCYTFDPPAGCRHAEVLMEAYRIQIARGDAHIGASHLADAIERLVARSQPSLSADRGPQDPY